MAGGWRAADLDWVSSDTLVVRVDGSGLLTAVGDGTARVTAQAGSVTGSSEVTVRVMAYVTQAVQSPRAPVPLVAGREALLRVFVTAERGHRCGPASRSCEIPSRRGAGACGAHPGADRCDPDRG